MYFEYRFSSPILNGTLGLESIDFEKRLPTVDPKTSVLRNFWYRDC